MKRLALLASLVAAILAPAAASAHPLGNFTINRFSRLEVMGDRVYVLYVLDMAEIPTFQAGAIDAGAYSRRIAGNLELRVAGRTARLVPVAHATMMARRPDHDAVRAATARRRPALVSPWPHWRGRQP